MDSERKRRIARQRGRELLEQPWRRAGLHEDDALKLAVEAQQPTAGRDRPRP